MSLMITEEELYGALLELRDASQAMVAVQHDNAQDIWAISDRYDDASVPARMELARVSWAG